MNDSIFDETLWQRKCFLDKIISEKTILWTLNV